MTGRMIGVDVGGTFTDIFMLNETDGTASVGKVPTSRPDQSKGFLAGITGQVADMADIAVVVHGTTAGTNALLERKGARIGAICTMGLRDVLEMRRRDRPRTWGLRGEFEPVVDRRDRLEVPERTLADSTIRTPVDLDAVRAAARQLRDQGCAAVAVLFANAYANSENENQAVAAVREIWHNEHVSCSSEILPEIREFERFSTTALNAYLQPEISGYLGRLEQALKQGGFDGEFMIVQSNGGVMDAETACRLPVRTALSGPAAGVIAAGYIAGSAGFDNVITGDMGGTSFDVSLIANGQSALAPQTSIDFGMVVRTPMIEITTIGAGGGSIAWVDKGGLLNIGPESAGLRPRPGRLWARQHRPHCDGRQCGPGPDRPAQSHRRQARSGSTSRPQAVPSKPMSATRWAWTAPRLPRRSCASPTRAWQAPCVWSASNAATIPRILHSCPSAAAARCTRVRCWLRSVSPAPSMPRYPGVTSALGCVIADMRQDFVQTLGNVVLISARH